MSIAPKETFFGQTDDEGSVKELNWSSAFLVRFQLLKLEPVGSSLSKSSFAFTKFVNARYEVVFFKFWPVFFDEE